MDTLKTARELKAAGLPQDQAEAVAVAIAGAQLDALADLATKADIARLEQATKADIARLEQATKTDNARLEQVTKNDIERLEQSTKADIARLEQSTKADLARFEQSTITEFRAIRAEMEILRRDVTIKMGTMFVVAVGVILAAIRYLPPPHP